MSNQLKSEMWEGSTDNELMLEKDVVAHKFKRPPPLKRTTLLRKLTTYNMNKKVYLPGTALAALTNQMERLMNESNLKLKKIQLNLKVLNNGEQKTPKFASAEELNRVFAQNKISNSKVSNACACFEKEVLSSLKASAEQIVNSEAIFKMKTHLEKRDNESLTVSEVFLFQFRRKQLDSGAGI